MKITRRQLRRLIRESMEDFGQRFDAAYKQPDGSYRGHPDDPGPMFAADIYNPGETAYDMGMSFEEYIQLYVDVANEVGVKVVQNTPDLFTVQGPEDAIIAWGSEVNSEEGGPSFNVEEFREYIMREV